LVNLNQSRNSDNITMIKSDITHSVKNTEDMRKTIKLNDAKKAGEMADVKMKLA
jgi:hypothetical protein